MSDSPAPPPAQSRRQPGRPSPHPRDRVVVEVREVLKGVKEHGLPRVAVLVWARALVKGTWDASKELSDSNTLVATTRRFERGRRDGGRRRGEGTPVASQI